MRRFMQLGFLVSLVMVFRGGTVFAEKVHRKDVCIENAVLVLEMFKADDEAFELATRCLYEGLDCGTGKSFHAASRALLLRERVTTQSHICAFGSNPKAESVLE